MQNIQNEFPILTDCIYANTAASGLMYRSLTEWRKQHSVDFLVGASEARADGMQNYIPGARKALATFLGCKVENVALVPNFSLGLNLLLEGLDKRSKILLLENDYPSVNWPFEDRGFSIEYARINARLEENIWEKLESGNFSVLALSLVQWLNGIKIDLEFLKKVKEEYTDLIIIADGTQYCGTERFDFEDSAIDILGASAYKWLLSGYGNGFLLFKDRVQEYFSVKSIGFSAANANKEMRNSIRFAKHFEPGHLDTFNFGSLKFSLDFLNGIGIDNIAAQNKRLSNKAKETFTNLGLLNEDITERKDHSTIFNIKGHDGLYNHLSKEKVICAQRGDGIRLSFHFYNTENDIDKIAKILKKGI
ncbi:aminotransferase class V-fold PLP-dependent enzyme [Maribacter halichondriae]|uniref:aminotransferase class V-fold PLP-dependent enzyme n=1 Tax=Maribacter halichondriae TaxID=2980554 RepID=UPI00235876E8|nr:aminotransferase class V-fold PLP-dependent enzyme [Maribacter sp. Hal144]